MNLRALLHPLRWWEHDRWERQWQEGRRRRIEAARRGEPCPDCVVYHDDGIAP